MDSSSSRSPQRSQQLQRLLFQPRLSRRCTDSTDSSFGGMGTAIFCPSLADVGTATGNLCPASFPCVLRMPTASHQYLCVAAWHPKNELIFDSHFIEVTGVHTDPTLHRLRHATRPLVYL